MDGEETRECTKVTAASEDLVLVVASGSGEAVVSLRGRSITIGRGASRRWLSPIELTHGCNIFPPRGSISVSSTTCYSPPTLISAAT